MREHREGRGDCPAETLAVELLAVCLGSLKLRSLPHVAAVSRRWRDAAQIAFASQLRWTRAAACRQLSLPVPAEPDRSSPDAPPSLIRKDGFFVTFLRSGDLIVQMVDAAQTAAVRTLCFAGGASLSLEPHEASRREFADHGPFNAGVGGIIGYRQGSNGMSFFPGVSGHKTTISEAVWAVDGNWDNVLAAGKVIFLLRTCSWWDDEEITADVLDTDSGGRAVVDVTPMRDALRLQLTGHDSPERCAVSAADGHFIFHLHTQSGAKVAAALRLPTTIESQKPVQAGSAVDAVSFVRSWPTEHVISRMGAPNERPCGEHLMLWEDDRGEEREAVESSHQTGPRFRINVVLLHASTGVATARELASPIGPQGTESTSNSVAAAFDFGGASAIDYAARSGIVAACSLPQSGLPPPAVLVWDWDSGACLHAVLLHPLPPKPQPQAVLARDPLRFAVGADVECRMSETRWVPGVVADHYPSEHCAYLIHLNGGEACTAPVDHPELIRPRGGGEDFVFDHRIQSMVVRAKASLAVHPMSTQIAIGLWHTGEAAGVLYSVDFGAR